MQIRQKVCQRPKSVEQVYGVAVIDSVTDGFRELLAREVLQSKHSTDFGPNPKGFDNMMRRSNETVPAQDVKIIVFLLSDPCALAWIRSKTLTRTKELADDEAARVLFLVAICFMGTSQPVYLKLQRLSANSHPIPQDLCEEVLDWIFAREVANVFPIRVAPGSHFDPRK